jgi:phage recombination protein Bet
MTQTESQSTALATIAPPRLAFPKGVEERFGVDRTQWKALVEAVFPLAKSPDSVVLALSYCKARRLDPFKRVVHIVPIWDSAQSREVETVWPGIAEHRTTAMRTGNYGGADPAVFGTTVERTFEGQTKKGNVSAKVSFPEFCQITVYRVVGGQRMPVPGPRVYWLEYFSKLGKANVPNDRWQRAPFQMIEKCAEAAALRRAFPEEFGEEATVEEAGFFDNPPMKDVTPPPAPTREQFQTPEPVRAPTPAEEEAADRAAAQFAQTGNGPESEPTDDPAGDPQPEVSAPQQQAAAPVLAPLAEKPTAEDIKLWLAKLAKALADATSVEDVNAIDEAAKAPLARCTATQGRNARMDIARRRVELQGGGA